MVCSKFEFHQVVTWVAGVNVSSDHRVILESWIAVHRLKFDVAESSLVPRLEHKMVWNVEDIKRILRRSIDDKLKWLEFFRWRITLVLCVEPAPELIFSSFVMVHPAKIRNEHVTIIFDKLFALRKDLGQLFRIVNECSQSIRMYHTVNFLWKLE